MDETEISERDCIDCGAEFMGAEGEQCCGSCSSYWDHVDAQIDEQKERDNDRD